MEDEAGRFRNQGRMACHALLQKLGGAVGRLPIGIGFDGVVRWSPVNKTGEDGVGLELGTQTVLVAFLFRWWDSARSVGIDMVPRCGIGKLAVRLMVKFAATPGDIAMLAEVLRERHPVLVLGHVAKPVQIAVDSSC